MTKSHRMADAAFWRRQRNPENARCGPDGLALMDSGTTDRLANLDKHGLDFTYLDLDFFLNSLIVPAQGHRLKVGRLGPEVMIAVVFAPLGTEAISVISMRFEAEGKGTCSMAAKRKAAPAGRGYTQADWDDASGNPEWSPEEMAKARPFAEVLPELAASARRLRGKQKAPAKQLISLRLDRSVIEAFQAEART